MADLEGNMNAKIEGIKLEVEKSVEKVKEVEQKANQIEKEIIEKNELLKDQTILMDCRLMDNYLRFRGVPESQEDVRQEMLNILPEFLEKPYEEVEAMCDDTYRVNSNFARAKKLPRDIIVKMTAHKWRDLVLRKHFQEPMEVLGKRIKIWKEIPKEVVLQRKQFKPLVEKLSQDKVRFRWEIPRGVSFLYESRKWSIRTTEQLNEF